MRSIKRLPGTVHSSLRSSVYLFDFTRVVEELIFNSVDAGSTKVVVSVNVGEFYVKVEDDGCGITREGLLLLQEKCATLKIQKTDSDECFESLSYRGETLGSLSDVSTVEIVTKTRGRPNGYHKIMKDWKCLYLGLDDCRKHAGTTVIVHDLFFNQPVRRRSTQSSPKKVLYSIKKSVLRIALIHPRVSFQLVDIENDFELLSTSASLSPMSLISAAFGNDKATSLCEVNFSCSIYQLSGYLSKPEVNASSKGFQYFYINSRYICKGPIHKLMDSLYIDYQGLINCWREEPDFQKRKRNKIHCQASYLLNLVCSPTLYDLIFEPSKAVAQFKDWTPVLSFIKQAVKTTWKPDFNPDSLGLHEDDEGSKQKICKAACSNQTECSSHSILGDIMDITSSKYNQIVTSSLPEESKILSEDMMFDRCCPVTEKVDSLDIAEKVTRNIQREDSVDYLTYNMMEYDVCDRDHTNISNLIACRQALENPIFECGVSVFDPGASELFSTSKGHGAESRDTTDICALTNYIPKSLPFTPDIHQSKVLGFSGSFMMRKCNTKLKPDFLAKNFISPCKEDLHHHFQESEVDIGNFGTPVQQCKDIFRPLNGVEWLSERPWSPGASTQNISNVFQENCGSYTKCTYLRDVFPDSFGLDEVDELLEYGNGILDNGNSRNLLTSVGDTTPNRYYFGKLDSLEIDIDTNCLETISPIKVEYDGTSWLESPSSLDENDSKFTDDHILLRYLQKCPVKMKRRSHSAPPFHKRKKKFASIYDHRSTTCQRESITLLSGNGKIQDIADSLEENSHLGNTPESNNEKIFAACSDLYARDDRSDTTEQNQKTDLLCTSNVDDHGDTTEQSYENNEQDDFQSIFIKWRSNGLDTTIQANSSKLPNSKHDILSIHSGLLNLAGSFVGSESISRDSLEGAKVLLQLDKKFIPIVADGTLSIIDQHAADERIRLEELREKVLSGKGTTVSYLESEQELVLPEVGLQLMQTYAEHIQKWGWICNIHVHCSESFSKNLTIMKRRPGNITLIAVPCILGVNLSDKDLIEYLEQLLETDGSSTVPPSVTRLLNLKACRGAIMFGDALLPSECSLLVDELKKTSLCFQCAHGRPTTVPIINLSELHNQLTKLEQHHGGTQSEWHGLHQHVPSIQRAQSRLNSSRRLGHV